MKKESEGSKPIQFVRELCKGKTEEEILEAEQNLREYLMVIKEICDRIELEERPPSDFDDSLIS